MPKLINPVRVLVVQTAPVLFDCEATTEKIEHVFSEQVASHHPNLVLFPEAFIPAYPRGLSFGAVVGSRSPFGREQWYRYWMNAVDVPGPVVQRLGTLAKKYQTYFAIGVIERQGHVLGGTLYCTMLYFDPSGNLMGKHRKIKPTGTERIIWGEGDDSTMQVFQTEIGKLGGLICWENYMPLARMHLYKQGVEIYLAPTADSRESWQATLRHIACEGRCFVLGCNQFVTKAMYPIDLPGYEELNSQPEIMCRGGSTIISPLGEVIVEPLYDKEGFLLAELDLSVLIKSRLDFDVVGHYSRPDLFSSSDKSTPSSHR